MSDPSKRSESLGIAIRMEKKGMAFYRDAGEKALTPLARTMFLSLVEDEKLHVKVFQEMADAAGVTPATVEEMDKDGAVKRIGGMFREAAKQVKENSGSDDDQIEAIDIAKGMEEKAYKFYSEMAGETDDPAEKDILKKIAEQENEHFRILDDTRLLLTNPAEWHIKEEKPLIDGG